MEIQLTEFQNKHLSDLQTNGEMIKSKIDMSLQLIIDSHGIKAEDIINATLNPGKISLNLKSEQTQ